MDNTILAPNTVGAVLCRLSLEPYTHVSIRRHGKNGVEYVGGGYPHTLSFRQRFDHLELVGSAIIDGILILYVR